MSDATATYRGYRKQALYVLWRVLTDDNSSGRSYRPEGAEDLAVFDSTDVLIEAIQVKALSGPLSLSNFKPRSQDGFVARAGRRQIDHPHCRHILATYGPLGPELRDAISAGDSLGEQARRKRTTDDGEADNIILLAKVLRGNVVQLHESQLTTDVRAVLQGSIAGLHVETALELLMYWIFESSELRRILTRESLLQQLQRIGEHLAGLRDHTTEWMVSVVPLTASSLDDNDQLHLRNEYRLGMQARWEHVLVDADSPRPARLAELHSKMSKHRAVIVRGASGQGKSTLALRYLHDYCADGLRFQVRFVEGRAHARKITTALRRHVESLRLNVVVLVDLAPTDSGWLELVQELVTSGAKVLVTVREEDLRRGGVLSPTLSLADLSLDAVTLDEARQIYRNLADARSDDLLDFEQAWATFSNADAGPLMEFTHLVTQGQTLTSTIKGQVRRLQAETSLPGSSSGICRAHLELLTLAAVANAGGCRVKFADLCREVGLSPIQAPLAVLDREYLVRLSEAGTETVLSSVHPLRSQAVEDALLEECPEMWGSAATRCLPLIVDDDVERFLLFAFSRRPRHRAELETAVNRLVLRTWSHAGAVGRALLWEGVNRYEELNHHVLAAGVAQYDEGWTLLCDPYLGSDGRINEGLREVISSTTGKDVPTIELSPKQVAFDVFRAWAACVPPPLTPPDRSGDWVALGDLSFLVGRAQVTGPLRDAIEGCVPYGMPAGLRGRDLAGFVSGRYVLGDSTFSAWLAGQLASLIDDYLRATDSLHVEDDGSRVKVLFHVKTSAADDDETDSWHQQAMRRVRMLRHVFPDRLRFASQGIGLEVFGDILPSDSTTKDIAAANLPLDREVQLNVMLPNLVNYRLRRASSWREYANEAFAYRRTIIDCFRELHRVWGTMLREVTPEARTIRAMPGQALDKMALLSRRRMFPKSAVDEWGFLSEDREREPQGAQVSERLADSVGRFKPWRKAWSGYATSVDNVRSKVVEVTRAHVAGLRVVPEAKQPDARRLLIVNLRDAWERLAEMQEEYRRWFASYQPQSNLEGLERDERATLRHLWFTALAYVKVPRVRVEAGINSLERASDEKCRRLIDRLALDVSRAVGTRATVRIVQGPQRMWDKRCLVVVCDHVSAASIQVVRAAVVSTIGQTIRAMEWSEFEWVPLAVEIECLCIAHLVRGKGLLPAGTRLSLASILTRDIDAEVQRHELIDLPLPLAEYEAVGLSVWESPLISTLLKFETAVMAFSLKLPSILPLLALTSAQSDPGRTLERIVVPFLREIQGLRTTAKQAYEELVAIMGVWGKASHATSRVDGWRRTMEAFQERLLMEPWVGDGPLSSDSIQAWVERFPNDMGDLDAFVLAVIDQALAEVQSN